MESDKQLLAISSSHHHASIDVREKLSVPADAAERTLSHLSAYSPESEIALLSTCNRTELYCYTDGNIDWLYERFAQCCLGKLESIRNYFRQIPHRDAVLHLFRVTSGVDSAIIGESEIHAQVKKALGVAQKSGTARLMLSRLFETALAASKSVRANTDIASYAYSYPGLIIKTAEHIFPKVAQCRILIIGAGDIIGSLLHILTERNITNITLANRTAEHIDALDAQKKYAQLDFADVENRLAEYDIIISATAASAPIIRKQAMEEALRIRKFHPMMLVDLGVPRNIDPAIEALTDVFLYTVDQIGAMATYGLEKRKQTVTEANVILEDYADHFLHWWRTRSHSQHVAQYRESVNALCVDEIDRAKHKLRAGADTDEVLQQLARRLSNKLIHVPSKLLSDDSLSDTLRAELLSGHFRNSDE